MNSHNLETRTWTEKPPSLGPRIGVDKDRTLGTNAAVFKALAGINTHPAIIPLGGRNVTEAEERALGNQLRQELADLIVSRGPATQTQALEAKPQ
jgi:hypothetical protein